MSSLQFRRFGTSPILVIPIFIAFFCSACTSSSTYYGIGIGSSKEGASIEAAQIQEIARRASRGDKEAQLELAIRFEEGDGVEKDIKSALDLLRQAAQESQISSTIFIPDGGAVRAERVFAGIRPGNQQAQQRLKRLESSARIETDNTAKQGLQKAQLNDRNPGVASVLEIVKAEYFSDECFYEAPESDEKLQELGFGDVGAAERLSEQFLLRVARTCLFHSELPETCELYSYELGQTLAYLVEVRKLHLVARSLRYFQPCLKGSDEKHEGRATRPTPMDFALRGTRHVSDSVHPELDEVSSTTIVSSQAKYVPHLFWRARCSRSISAIQLELVDLMVCDAREANQSQLDLFKQIYR
ncbi:MAG: hypothetical protein AAFY19_01965 [Pseudomonadota bacterium]